MKSRSKDTANKSRNWLDNSKPPNPWSITLKSPKEPSTCVQIWLNPLPDSSQLSLSTSWSCAKTRTSPRKSSWKSPTIKSLVSMLTKSRNKKTMKERIQKKNKNHNPSKKNPNHLNKRLKDKSNKKRDSTKTKEYWSLFRWQFQQLENRPFSAQFRPITKTFRFIFFHQTRSDCQWWSRKWKRPKVSADKLRSKSPANRQIKSFTTKCLKFTKQSQSPNKINMCFWSTRTTLRTLWRRVLRSIQRGQKNLPIWK